MKYQVWMYSVVAGLAPVSPAFKYLVDAQVWIQTRRYGGSRATYTIMEVYTA